MTAVFEEFGLSIQYPENWKLTRDESDRLPYQISIESPSGNLWILHVFPPHNDAKQLAGEILKTLAEQYESLEYTKTTELVQDLEMQGYDTQFFCLDLLIEARLRYFSTDQYSFVILTQAEDREFEKNGLVFQAITTSFVSDLR